MTAQPHSISSITTLHIFNRDVFYFWHLIKLYILGVCFSLAGSTLHHYEAYGITPPQSRQRALPFL